MAIINIGEFGLAIRINTNEDISAATVTMVFLKNGVTKATKSATTPVTNVTLDDGTVFTGGQYAEYILEDGLFDSVGPWNVYLQAVWSSPAKKLRTENFDITVT